MTTAVENHSRQYGGMGFDAPVYHHHNAPLNLSDPWATVPSSSHSNAPIYTTTPIPAGQFPLNPIKQEDVSRHPPVSLSYSNLPVSAPSLLAGNGYSTGYPSTEVMTLPHEMPRPVFEQTPSYSTAPHIGNYGQAGYHMGYAQPLPSQENRRISHTSHRATQPQPSAAPTFGDALDASRGMVALSQDLTPRNAYGSRNPRATVSESFGFSGPQSSVSAMAPAPNYPYYSTSVGSVESSITDYSSTTSESYENCLPRRTLPRPSSLLNANAPSGPQSMMSQFSSKIPSNAQKKHKCKVCDKRFTRPSSLQTHMYSHTGEKPFACDVEGCGRHFSVVSNLRRHKKVHKGEKDGASGEDE